VTLRHTGNDPATKTTRDARRSGADWEMMTMPHDETDWTIGLQVDAVLRGQGMDPEPVRARSPRVVAAAEDAIEQGRDLLRPRVFTREYQVMRHERDRLVLDGGEFRCGELLAGRLGGARRLVVIGATVGDELLRHAVDVSDTDVLLALGMQGVGAAAVEDLAVQACRTVSVAASEAGESGVLCWPGSAVWPNDEAQPQIFDLLGPDGLAGEGSGEPLRLDEHLVVRPVTSLTFAIAVAAAREEAGKDTGGAAEPAATSTGSCAGGAQGPCETCAAIPVCNFSGC
jgi:hypothetical protein